MRLSDWHVTTHNPNGHYRAIYYGELKYIAQYVAPDAKVVPKSEWTADDMVNIASGLFEDCNFHSRIEEPRELVMGLRQVGTDEDHIKKFMMHKYLPWLFNKYGDGL